MIEYQNAVFDRINGHTFTIALAEYPVGSGDKAIFSGCPVPENAERPYIVIDDPWSDEAWDTKTTVGRQVYCDVKVYCDDDGDPTTVKRIAEEVRTLFHRDPVLVSGYGGLICGCSGPTRTEAEDQVYGQRVTLRQLFIKRP